MDRGKQEDLDIERRRREGFWDSPKRAWWRLSAPEIGVWVLVLLILATIIVPRLFGW